MKFRVLVHIIIAGYLLSSCSTINQIAKKSQETIDKAQKYSAQSDKLNKDSLISYSNSIFVSSSPFVVKDSAPILPAIFSKKLVIYNSESKELNDILMQISQITGIQISLTQDNIKASDDTASRSTLPKPIKIDYGAQNTTKSDDKNTQSDSNFGLLLQINEPLKKVLDNVSYYFGYSWKYDPSTNSITVYKYITKTFNASVVRGTTTSKTAIANGTSGSMSAQKSTLNIESAGSDSWNEIESALNKILSGIGNYRFTSKYRDGNC